MSCYIDLLYHEYLIYTFVKCKSGNALPVMRNISNITCIVTKMYIERDFVVLLTDTDEEMIREDKDYLTEIISPLKNVIYIRHKVQKQNEDD